MRTRSRRRIGLRRPQGPSHAGDPASSSSTDGQTPLPDIAPNDPVVAFFTNAPGAVDIDTLQLDSPGLEALRDSGVKLVVPLVSQGELIGLLNLGPRLSAQVYSADDRKLLENLAGQAAPALRVAQLVREQEAEIRMRERYQQELQIAHLIQQNFLPKQAPELAGWNIAAFYRSAREVGGDFYDFVDLSDGKVGIVIGDVTDKGVPAALVMASTRSVLRGAAKRDLSPGQVLERVNELVCPEMPPKMFVTCLYAVLDPASGHMRYANAGHNLPYKGTGRHVDELRARGMPLGLLPGMTYEEQTVEIAPGETVLFSSDGVAEAHSPDGDMFGCPRLMDVVGTGRSGSELIDETLTALDEFTGPHWEQEDDITLVTLERLPQPLAGGAERTPAASPRELATFRIASESGNERQAMALVAEAVEELELAPDCLEKLKTAVAEGTMNAIEHGNENRPELDVHIAVTADAHALRVAITDHGGREDIPESPEPDLDAKLAGEQTPRGWGLFLIKNMVDEMNVSADETHHTIELVVYLEGGADGV